MSFINFPISYHRCDIVIFIFNGLAISLRAFLLRELADEMKNSSAKCERRTSFHVHERLNISLINLNGFHFQSLFFALIRSSPLCHFSDFSFTSVSFFYENIYVARIISLCRMLDRFL